MKVDKKNADNLDDHLNRNVIFQKFSESILLTN